MPREVFCESTFQQVMEKKAYKMQLILTSIDYKQKGKRKLAIHSAVNKTERKEDSTQAKAASGSMAEGQEEVSQSQLDSRTLCQCTATVQYSWYSTASTAQHSTQHSTAQHSTAQYSTAQYNSMCTICGTIRWQLNLT